MKPVRLIDERLLDRLVDNELDAAGRRELLKTLDESPEGWRRCALAFLEAQAWRSDLRTTVGASAPIKAPAGQSPLRSRAAGLRRAGLIAAAVTVGFSAGWLFRPGVDAGRDDGSGPASTNIVRRDEGAPPRPAEQPATDGSAGPQAAPEVRLAGVLTLEVGDRDQPRTVQVPVIEGRGIDTRWLLEQPPAIRASVVRALERRGHRVEAHRQLVTVGLKDGRRLVLPVDEVDVQFAGRVFQ